MKLKDITTEDTTTLVGLLSIPQKDELIGVYYAEDSIYNPIQDIDDNWVISIEEMQETINENTIWVKDLELITYQGKIKPVIF